ncbi:DUF1501 domain-containing protein [Phytohabitans sp. ZYX-F-186]|uniref:DUF1501 domain-containing protein n=1 Tax=Phytohabitans maris TaxID=3071409 RepID=A0ABU0Z817_9ACTN|nr:DUF1501 domain-containing protein [Phytohabitans sp. ZYX-F-186]MDQ7903193.1 DUF1501 domain-containing protein [Phytohabitans sp. ZYX-F-186]
MRHPELSRRAFLTGAAATLTAVATSQALPERAAYAASAKGTLVHVFLHGGLDGLSVVAPTDEPVLEDARPNLLMTERTALAVDRSFRLSSAFTPLERYLKDGQLGFVPGVSDPRLSRSHFQAVDMCDLGGLPREAGGRGWLDRLVDELGPGTAFRGVGVGTTFPRSLVGANGALALSTVDGLALNGEARFKDSTLAAIGALYKDINHPVQDAVGATLAAARAVPGAGYRPAEGVEYDGIGLAFRQVAQLVKSGANVRVAAIAMGGWDTHEDQGTEDGGYLHARLSDLARGMAAFFADLGPAAADVTVLVSSEFGRRVAESGTGTDHGHGGVVMLLSGRKLTSSLIGRWDGLDALDSGDVPEFNNLFDVYGSVAQGQFGLTDAQVARIFPQRRYAPMKLFTV